MLEASNIRQILRDTLAILVWHAVFSSLSNTSIDLTDIPAWRPGFFFTGPATSGHHFDFSDIRDACLFGKHVTPVRGTLVANGPSPTAFPTFRGAFPIFSPRSFFHLLPSQQRRQVWQAGVSSQLELIKPKSGEA
ncbi:hypothetical protein CRENBAI_018462 [Crenichthys baileyi]|uniref:Uncharacterized protein n=1 Tax=Crenichthys baileyi TaxID=28760 RepID=A0AAV9SAI9_9TELE